MSNLLKAGYIKEVGSMIIDSNNLIEEKLESIKEALFKENTEGLEHIHDGFTSGIRAEVIEELPDPQEELNLIKEEAERIKQEADTLLEQAKQEAQQIRTKALQEAEMLKENARESGRQEGYQQGQRAAFEEIEQEKGKLEEERECQRQEYQRRVEQIEPELVEVITKVFEKVIHAVGEEKKDIILHLVDNALEHAESSKEFLVRVSKEDYNFVSSHKQMLKEKLPNSSNIEIIKDATLKKNQCFIETDGGVFDCSLDTQLEKLIQDMKALSIK